MNFGLGLVLSFTDNASAGINNAVNSLNRLTNVAENAGNSLNEVASLSALSAVAIQVGHSFTNAGGTILSTFANIISSVNKTGQTLMFAENQLDALYAKSGKSGAEVISQIQEYAKTSMFEFENLIPAVTQLKSVGIEAFDSITSSTGNAQYSLLDYASALASFAPQMKNAYGTGINAAIGAMREYIAEGNAMSLKRGAGLDITGILGEDKGASVEERTRQVADLIETLNMMPMVDAMSNSPMTKLSNMGDTLFQFAGMVANSGVYDAFSELIDIFANFVSSIDEARLQTIATNVGEALSSLMTPVKALSRVVVTLAEGLLTLLEVSPLFTKIMTIGTALGGVLLVLGGVALVFMGSISLLSLAVTSFSGAIASLTKIVGGLALKVLPIFKTFTIAVGLMYLAWKSDLLGIRTNVTYFVNNMVSSFKTARQAVNGSVENLISTLADLRSKDDFFSNLTIGIMKVQMVFKALKDAWGDYTLSEENFLKAKELGILPLIEAILDLKYRFENFARGFKTAVQTIAQDFAEGIASIASKAKGTFLEPIINAFTKFFQLLSSGDAETWYKFGEVSGVIFSALLTAIPVIKVIETLIGVVGKLSAAFSSVWGVLTTIGGGFLKFGGIVAKVVGGVFTAIGALVGLPAWAVGLITAGLVAIVAVVIKYREEIFSALKAMVGWINTNIIQPVISAFKNLWNNIVSLFTTIGTAVSEALGGAIRGAVNTVLSGAVNLINGFINALNGAIGIINKIPGVSISAISQLQVPQLAEGGVVDKPTMSLIGEAGKEAVVPLENNLGWISKLAGMITEQMIPINSRQTNTSTNSGRHYMTNQNSGEKVYHDNTNNSVVFSEGAINITVQNATEEEAINLAKKIMEYIKRQKELDRMMSYA